ncbi:MAG TPA: polysaccharide deacetylase family protein [Anaerolineales bacterium]|nr:polysaccharide deacetylase family protein [Anaerolineales bacterium]
MEHEFAWPDRFQGAVSLTYDDGLPIHCSVVDPLLREHSLRATFYPMTQSDLRLHPTDWRELAAAGHELGNHTVFHPCRQNPVHPHAWLDERYDLRTYTPAQLRAELEAANLVLHLLDGETERSYGNTCCDTSFGRDEQPIEPLLSDLFIAARGALTNRIARPTRQLDLYNIGCIDAAGYSLADLQGVCEQARVTGGWAVLMIHGVGAGTHELYVDSDVHRRFIQWLARQDAIWTSPVRNIAAYVREQLLRDAESS